MLNSPHSLSTPNIRVGNRSIAIAARLFAPFATSKLKASSRSHGQRFKPSTLAKCSRNPLTAPINARPATGRFSFRLSLRSITTCATSNPFK